MSANTVVAPDDLMARVWGDALPSSARSTLHTYVSRLRTALDSGSESYATLVRRNGGYALDVDERTLDVTVFRDAVAEAQARIADPSRCAAAYRRALAAWPGPEPALHGITGDWAQRWRDILGRERVTAQIHHDQAELRCGVTPELVERLGAAVGAQPDSEPSARNLMEGLYRLGRRDEALAEYERLRSRLESRLGVEPSAHSARLRDRIQAGAALEGDPSGARLTPRQLPRDIAFVGREQELQALGDVRGDHPEPPVVRIIEGPPGVGKSALALRWAHQVSASFTGGQVYLDLRAVADPPEFLRWSAGDRDDGAPGDARYVPDVLPASVAVDCAPDGGLLVVVDHVSSVDPVLAVLDARPDAVVVATVQAGLRLPIEHIPRRTRRVRLTPMPSAQAEHLFTHIVGRDRVQDELDAVARILDVCGNLPRAVVEAAEDAVARPNRSLRALADELDVADRRATR